MARILGVTERTIIDLEAGRPLSEGIGRRVTELDRLQRDLSKVVRPQAIRQIGTTRRLLNFFGVFTLESRILGRNG